jgi:hypothetical protein
VGQPSRKRNSYLKSFLSCLIGLSGETFHELLQLSQRLFYGSITFDLQQTVSWLDSEGEHVQMRQRQAS